MRRRNVNWLPAAGLLVAMSTAAAEVRVQDVGHLQGQRTNKLQGIGLVVGLKGTGDGGKNPRTVRALGRLHQRYQQPLLDLNDLKDDNNVAFVTVEATIPEYGAREGQAVDVVVSAFAAKSLEGGQLLTTPLQFAMFNPNDPSTQAIFALAGGKLELTDPKTPTRAVIRRGATLEQDFFYNFVQEGTITIVLDDAQAGYPLAQMVARAINHELANPSSGGLYDRTPEGELVAETEPAVAIGPKNVVVRIPSYEQAEPAAFISRVLQAPLFVMPQQPARVVINRTTRSISFTGTVRISPTILQIPGLGMVNVGGASGEPPAPGVVGVDTSKSGGVDFQQLLDSLSQIKLTPQQMIDAVEQLHSTGTLHAQLTYRE